MPGGRPPGFGLPITTTKRGALKRIFELFGARAYRVYEPVLKRSGAGRKVLANPKAGLDQMMLPRHYYMEGAKRGLSTETATYETLRRVQQSAEGGVKGASVKLLRGAFDIRNNRLPKPDDVRRARRSFTLGWGKMHASRKADQLARIARKQIKQAHGPLIMDTAMRGKAATQRQMDFMQSLATPDMGGTTRHVLRPVIRKHFPNPLYPDHPQRGWLRWR